MAKRKSNTVRKVAKLMRDLDICMLTTSSARGGLHARPMSNNGQVEFDGGVWFFSAADSRKVREIEASPRVHLSYADIERSRFISMAGRARIVRNAKKKQQLWLKELDQWFEAGPDSEAIVLIKVTPTLVSYWTRNDEGEVRLK